MIDLASFIQACLGVCVHRKWLNTLTLITCTQCIQGILINCCILLGLRQHRRETQMFFLSDSGIMLFFNCICPFLPLLLSCFICLQQPISVNRRLQRITPGIRNFLFRLPLQKVIQLLSIILGQCLAAHRILHRREQRIQILILLLWLVHMVFLMNIFLINE